MAPTLWASELLRDIRFALRQYRQRPGFALLAVLTLALGIGATTAVYTIVHAVLLGPLPFTDSDRLVMVWDNEPRDGDRFNATMVSGDDLREYTRSSKLLDRFISSGRIRPVLHRGDVAKRTWSGLVTVGTFRDTLGSQALLGRAFVDEDQKAGCVVVLAHRFWTRVLNGDASLVGQGLRFDETDCTVVGVMPLEFDLFPIGADMWFLRDHAPAAAVEILRRRNDLDEGIVYARLRPGATAEQAEAELTGLHRALQASNPTERGRVAAVVPVRSAIMGEVSPSLDTSLWLAFGAVALLLLIACVNVANLLLARMTDRQRELVVRAALGSGRARLIRQMLTEGALLAAAGTLLGIGVAWTGVRAFHLLNPFELPLHAGQADINVPVLLFAVGLSIATTLVFTLLPALAGSKIDLSQSLRAAGRGFFGLAGRGRTAQAMVVVEVALSFVLLTGAGLLMSSVVHLEQEQLGYDVSGIASASADLPPDRYPTRESRAAFERTLRERVQVLPGVRSVVFGNIPPDSFGGDFQIEVQGQAVEPVFDVAVEAVTSGYLEMLRVPLVRGRMFTNVDRNGPALAIVSQRFVAEYLKGRNPLGQTIRTIYGGTRGEWKTIVGVVGEWKHMVDNTAWRDTPMVFSIGGTPRFSADGFSVSVSVRTTGDPQAVSAELRKQIAALDPRAIPEDSDVPAERLLTMLKYSRFRALLLVAFGAGALLLAAVGLYGVVAQLVAQRMPEFGVRRAVGAQARDLAWLVARQGGAAVAMGLIAGVIGALATGRFVGNMLYGLEASDPRILSACALVLAASAALAMALPARRAARVDPMVALRQD